MDVSQLWEDLIRPGGGRIVYVVVDGVGGLPDAEKGGTELQVARTPNLDRLARESACGLLETVGPGITPGSGPGHLSLFGYNPLICNPGRGVLSALGIGFDLKEGDVAARVNFATMNENGQITDRRAGRMDSETNERLCEKIRDRVRLDMDGEFFFKTVREYRSVLVLRGRGLGGDLTDTDPQQTGKPPKDPQALNRESEQTERLVTNFLKQSRDILSQEQQADTLLLRGFEKYQPLPSLKDRFGLKGVCIAEYPMYRGVSRLIGMDVAPESENMEDSFDTLRELYGEGYDFYFLHVKKTDSRGEDGNFEQKMAVIEAVDKCIPSVVELDPDALVVTADHSTPASMRSHSWHPVPVMLRSERARVDRVKTFDELACIKGALGLRPGVHLMGLALAHAGRLKKYGA
ncbi:MAG: 2,3-bisphosphoglycerate-independent phosphoglycerate mutase [Deltaproteobacteria bacterium]|nr:2,3-bisphosphoglycerate-independent phosphoglycerate mutase [Deltaproteobacteria bacterium]